MLITTGGQPLPPPLGKHDEFEALCISIFPRRTFVASHTERKHLRILKSPQIIKDSMNPSSHDSSYLDIKRTVSRK